MAKKPVTNEPVKRNRKPLLTDETKQQVNDLSKAFRITRSQVIEVALQALSYMDEEHLAQMFIPYYMANVQEALKLNGKNGNHASETSETSDNS